MSGEMDRARSDGRLVQTKDWLSARGIRLCAWLLLGFLLQSYLAVKVFGQDFPVADRWKCLAIAMLALGAMERLHRRVERTLLYLVGEALVLLGILFVARWPWQLYADTEWMIRFVEQASPFSRWLQSTALLGTLYAAVWKSPFFVNHADAFLRSTEVFLRLAGILFMLASGVYLLRRRPADSGLRLVLLCGAWAILGTGFLKSYPFVAPVLLFSLVWLTDQPLRTRRPRDLGLLLACLATAYVGLVPVAGLVLVVLAFWHREKLVATLLWAGLFGYLIIALLWPSPPPTFFASLYYDLNLGELHTAYPAYQGQSAGPNSINFAWPFILSSKHLYDKAYILLYGGTLLLLLILPRLIIQLRKAGFYNFIGNLKESRGAFLALLCAFEVWHSLRAIPKLGPRQDILFFFPMTLVLAFSLGWFFDRSRTASSGQLIDRLYPLLLGARVPLIYLVCFHGIPVI